MSSRRGHEEPERSYRQVLPRPQLGVLERADDFEVVAELPSSRPEDVTVQLEAGALTIRARRSEAPTAPGEPAGWQVSLAFGDLVRGDAQVVIQEGVLLVTLPKAPAASRLDPPALGPTAEE